MNLQGRRVVITRPADQADALKKQLQDVGASVIHLPLLEIKSLDSQHDAEIIQKTRHAIQQLDQFHKIIFISTNAVRYALPLLENNWPQWPLGLQWYGIGVATQNALNHELEKTGSNVAAASPSDNAMTSEALLSLPIFAELHQQRILIVQGDGGRGLLAEVFKQRGAQVETLICYRRAKPELLNEQWSVLDVPSIDAILISSGEALHNLLQLPDLQSCKKALIILPSERVATIARQAGFVRCVVAMNASDVAMMDALKDSSLRSE
jgi:uroporphyrinogen-III synthase